MPAVLSRINQVFSDHHINISAQCLQTRDVIALVVIARDTGHSDAALAKQASVPGTLRSRGLF